MKPLAGESASEELFWFIGTIDGTASSLVILSSSVPSSWYTAGACRSN